MAGIYVHIPFCHGKCAYCDFYSMPNRSLMPALASAIPVEYSLRRGEIEHAEISTLYFGGGTPSILPIEMFAGIVDALPHDNIQEFTIEANPEDIVAEKVRAWKQIGVNRVSMGVQSLIDSELKIIARRHTTSDAIRAIDILRNEGVENISLDLIYGLPTQTIETWQYSLDRLLALHPQHLSAYILSYEHGTRLTAQLRKGEVSEASEDTILAMYDALCRTARQHGYLHYEISNFALPGYEAKHNCSYWDGLPYLGLGPAAHSYDGKIRRMNMPHLKKYLDAIGKGLPAFEIDHENAANRQNDYVMTRLRTASGIDVAQLNPAYRTRLIREAAPHIKRGTLAYDHGRLYIPESQWLVSDDTISDLMIVE